MLVSKVTISPITKQLNSLTPIKRKQLRREAIMNYINSKPAGTPITTRDLQTAAQISAYPTAYSFIRAMISDGHIGRTQIGNSRKYEYYVRETDTYTLDKPDKVIKTPLTTTYQYEPDEEVTEAEVQKAPSDDLKDQAIRFAWEHDSDSLREFIKWIGA